MSTTASEPMTTNGSQAAAEPSPSEADKEPPEVAMDATEEAAPTIKSDAMVLASSVAADATASTSSCPVPAVASENATTPLLNSMPNRKRSSKRSYRSRRSRNSSSSSADSGTDMVASWAAFLRRSTASRVTPRCDDGAVGGDGGAALPTTTHDDSSQGTPMNVLDSDDDEEPPTMAGSVDDDNEAGGGGERTGHEEAVFRRLDESAAANTNNSNDSGATRSALDGVGDGEFSIHSDNAEENGNAGGAGGDGVVEMAANDNAAAGGGRHAGGIRRGLILSLHSDSGSDANDDDDNFLDDLDDVDDDDDDLDDDSDDDENSACNNAELLKQVRDVLDKPKPSYAWNTLHELMYREQGLERQTGGAGGPLHRLPVYSHAGFETRYYASRHVVERMKLSHCLRKHRGCVNCLSFNRGGDLLCSGSDDTRIVVWDWAANRPLHTFRSGHTGNIFQTKFVDTAGCLDIVSASHDGQVRRAVIPPSGGQTATTHCLYKHRDPVHKLVVCPNSRSELISVGEDGYIRSKDLRSDEAPTDMLKVMGSSSSSGGGSRPGCGGRGDHQRRVRLFSIAHHPYAPEIVVSGSDNLVRVYDKRRMAGGAVNEMCPEKLLHMGMPQVTCAVYNHNGEEVLASYSDENIYLFDNRAYKSGSFLHCYRGHYNHGTIKGVNFFGPRSEYVISGSDCAHIFYWCKHTEAIINYMPGDTTGVVNCLEPHPSVPILATSGLDHNVKIWTPNSESYPPDLSNLELRVKCNMRRTMTEENDNFEDQEFYHLMRQFTRHSRSLWTRQRRGAAAAMLDPGDDDDDDDDDDDYELERRGGAPTYTLPSWPLNDGSSISSTDSSSSAGSALNAAVADAVGGGGGAAAGGTTRRRGGGGGGGDDDDDDGIRHLERLNCRTQ